MKAVQPPVPPTPTSLATSAPSGSTAGGAPDEAIVSAAEALETSSLLLELVHAAYATRAADGAPGGPGGPGHGGLPGSEPGVGAGNVSPHAVRAAIHVHQHRERTIGELARGLGISIGWASRVVGELEAAGMIVRSAEPSDRRVVRIALTDEATAMVEGVYRWRGDAVARALGGLDGAGREAVRRFLRRVVDELSAAPERRPPAG